MARHEATAIRGNNNEYLPGGLRSHTGRTETLTAARTLTEADSGLTFFLAASAGFAITLPSLEAVDAGTQYEFLVSTSVGSGNMTITAQAGDLLRGAVYITDFDTANTGSYFAADESDDLIFTMNGSTKGGKKGTRVRFIAKDSTAWFVEGLVHGDGALATPFS